MEVIYNVFKWLVTAIHDVVNIITSIPRYVGMLISLINTFIPQPILSIFLLALAAYVIISIKRLVF